MKFEVTPSSEGREEADLILVPCWEPFTRIPEFRDLTDPILKVGDFQGKEGELLFLYPTAGPEKRLLLFGLGSKDRATGETFRRAFASAIQAAWKKKQISRVNIFFPGDAKGVELLRGAVEGVLLSHYQFNPLKGKTVGEAPPPLKQVSWIGLKEKNRTEIEKWQTIGESISMARDLVNGNADDVTPHTLAETAKRLHKDFSKLRVDVRDLQWLKKERMGLILAVARGAEVPPYLIEIGYRGEPRSKQHVVLVGKGVTYDTGGLALKTLEGMLAMKCDMAGAAAVMGVMRAVAALGLKTNVTALIPTVENAISAKSYKIGDVYRSYAGITVEVTNTDAEGRLILADAISYAVKHLKPTQIIDIGTLTGGIVAALGDEIAGLFSNDDLLAKNLMGASQATGELLWRLPIHAGYKETLKSDLADLLNSSGKDLSAMKVALFLEDFVEKIPWAHLDIAGTAFLNKPKLYHPTKATGFGVRLLTHFLEQCAS